jgi:predicted MFS family arabinose efflux permease
MNGQRPARGDLLLIFLFRTVLNSGYRMMYPFLPAFSRGLGVDLKTMSLALSVRAASGALGPLLSPLSDRHGRRLGMGLGTGVFTLGAAVAFMGRGLPQFTAGLVLMTVGRYLFDPAALAHLGDRFPYSRRAFALAVSELSWALAFILGVPAVGLLMARAGWRAPFAALAVLGLAGLTSVVLVMRNVRSQGLGEDGPPGRAAGSVHLEKYKEVFGSAAALAALTVVLSAGTANELVNVAFGRWLEDSFGLKLAALGLASALIGVCEFAGEGLVALTTDRIGKSRAVGFGLAACAVVSLLLPLGGRSAVTAVAGLALFYFAFEYMVVSLMPLVSEILPGARATLMAFYAAAVSVGRAFGSWLSPRLYEAGFMSVTAAAAALYAAAFLLLLRLRRLSGGKD